MQIFLMSDATLEHYCYFNMTITLQRSSVSLFNTDLVSLNFTRLAIQVTTSDETSVGKFQCFAAYSALHTTDTFHEFI